MFILVHCCDFGGSWVKACCFFVYYLFFTVLFFFLLFPGEAVLLLAVAATASSLSSCFFNLERCSWAAQTNIFVRQPAQKLCSECGAQITSDWNMPYKKKHVCSLSSDMQDVGSEIVREYLGHILVSECALGSRPVCSFFSEVTNNFFFKQFDETKNNNLKCLLFRIDDREVVCAVRRNSFFD